MSQRTNSSVSYAGTKLVEAVEATAALRMSLNLGRNNPALWVRWAFAVESLPIFDRACISKVRALAWWGLCAPSDPVAMSGDVQRTFRSIRLLLL